ncbi:MAG TPA: NADH-quinone oxidoreductase subunit NuoE [Devosiaceae bacterium]|jgi:NADH-quinone oxidoreductase subunit E|nr:NADH-quinone oxidoreductase subunit NuoE [Devosiaceae bacterium]
MSVRRLADEAIQPTRFAFSAENRSWADRKIAEYPAGRQQSAVIPLLMRAQDQEGWISRPAIESIAAMLDMAYIRVLEVATFYTQFQLKPVGTRAHIQVCGTTPCMLRGAEQLREVCERRIHPEPHHPSADGTMSWEEVECLGACVNAPMVMIGQDAYEDLTVERFEEIVEIFAAGNGASVEAGPQIDRRYSAPEAGQTTLLETPTAQRSYKPFPPPEAPPAEMAAKPAAEKPAAEQKPTKPGRGDGDVPEEAAPALKQPAGAPKASVAEAERERAEFDADHDADGEPNDAMREDATGAESPAGKKGTGKAPGKPTRGVPAAAASPAGTDREVASKDEQAAKPDDSGVSPSRDAAGKKPPKPQDDS